MRIITTLLVALVLISCKEEPVRINDSAGKLNDILIVVNSENWDGEIGDTIRNVLARPIDGLVRDEAMFTLNQVKPESFKGMLKKSRNYLFVRKSDTASVGIRKNKYATPQIGVIVQGKDTREIAEQISENADNIVTIFKQGELTEKQRLIDRVRLNTDRITDRFGIDMNVPTAYRYAAVDDPDFTWLRRNIVEGTMDMLIYEVPLSQIQRDSSVVQDIVAVRDSIGLIKIPTDGGPFRTEPAFSPYVNETQVDGRFAFETKGTWEVRDMFMAGPFLNYAIYNADKEKWLIVEGYISAPNAVQRNYLFEIEAILNSIRFVEKEDNQ
ncbi:DUF4837 family protein [Nonlabens ponticola]|uniref:DUF4837 family protein n=1 Tax=Nonlabens ponticola TaxID=2496866 RepID=A0A3S9MVG7_9FLAO|nr:DUF4837 family protein [Nonlabens ponticola]AZQ43134.1 DUF4837 family protein [Nonlabens ponticola]